LINKLQNGAILLVFLNMKTPVCAMCAYYMECNCEDVLAA